MSDLVSIITPSYNSYKYIENCISSVIEQTYKNWEMIIVDDCSKDNCVKIINHFLKKDLRIQAIYLDNNIGAAGARNLAISKAKGKYIAFLDSDDSWKPKKLELQISFMKRHDIAFSYTTYQIISHDGLNKSKIIRAPDKITYSDYLKNTIIGCLTVIIDIEKVGSFAFPNIRSSHDMALWLLILRKGFTAFGLDINLAKYRIVYSSNSANKIKAARDVWKVYRELEKLSFFYSSWCFFNYLFNAIKKRVL